MLRKRIQLGMLHMAVAMTLVPINSTLNRVMIKELAISATLVAILASLPYLFSPIQVAIGSFADRHPLWGMRRTPYIFAGLLLCVVGVVISPFAAFLMADSFWAGLGVGVLAFGAWGMGYNLSSVSYLSLASELSGEKGRSKTIAVMFFMMISSIIVTAIGLSRLVDPYTPEALVRAFLIVGFAALVLGLVGLVKLEQRHAVRSVSQNEDYTWSTMARFIFGNQQAKLFFIYLTILLAAILGQDILLEPFGAEAFGLSVRDTTRITSIWGTCVLIALAFAGLLEGRVRKRSVALWGGWAALAGFVVITLSGLLSSLGIFYTGVVLLGIGTGLATVSNLSLMLDMTTAGSVGLFIGAWGMANAFSRMIGSVLGGGLRDFVTQLVQDPIWGYLTVFIVEALFLLASLWLLRRIDVSVFHQKAYQQMSVLERAAIVE
ncbi:MAG: BCD family MFS transporter [Anaerolineales bacterium]|nr:BCD family MFS transporter [Anaerolineales bacterium]